MRKIYNIYIYIYIYIYNLVYMLYDTTTIFIKEFLQLIFIYLFLN
jgi:hypothetical protein